MARKQTHTPAAIPPATQEATPPESSKTLDNEVFSDHDEEPEGGRMAKEMEQRLGLVEAVLTPVIGRVFGPLVGRFARWYETQQGIKFWEGIYATEYQMGRAQLNVGGSDAVSIVMAGAAKVASKALEERNKAMAKASADAVPASSEEIEQKHGE